MLSSPLLPARISFIFLVHLQLLCLYFFECLKDILIAYSVAPVPYARVRALVDYVLHISAAEAGRVARYARNNVLTDLMFFLRDAMRCDVLL